MRRVVRLAGLALALLALPTAASAEWQLKPFAGVTFGGDTTLLDLDKAAGSPRRNLGVSVTWLGEVVGIEADVGRTGGFFQRDGGLLLASHATTVTGNVVVALPARMAQYTLRPYVVGGVGLLHVGWEDNLGVLPLSEGLFAMDLGAGATGFLNENVGVNWDVRIFRTLNPDDEPLARGLSLGPARLSFWRASMGLTIRP